MICVNTMDLFYPNGSLYWCFCSYLTDTNISLSKRKKNIIGRKKQVSQYHMYFYGLYLSFLRFSFLLIDSKSFYLVKQKHFQKLSQSFWGQCFCSEEMTLHGPSPQATPVVRHILYKDPVNSNCNIS